jgi:hypothetical protein
MPSHTNVCVGSTGEGIRTVATAEQDDIEPTVERAEDSEIDENRDILDLEMRDFNDKNGIEKDTQGDK